MVSIIRPSNHQPAGAARNAVYEPLLLDKTKMLPDRIRAPEAEVRRRLLECGNETGLPLSILYKRQDLPLSGC
jgi:hypothetical protein